jgi:DNA processing protein
MTELEARIVLNMLPDLSSSTIKKLLDYFKTAKSALKANEQELVKSGLVQKSINKFKSGLKSVDLEAELKLVKKLGVEIISLGDSNYPKLLSQIYDPPIILYVMGELEPEAFKIAVVGSRQASFYGLKMAENFSYKLASLGITIVSGLARGIDTASHKGALKAGGKTIAVLGSGLGNVYPPENKGLFEQIADCGAVVSEFPMLTKPFAYNFPRRNRIISGMSSAVLVVEAAKRSGALITANCALDQGRDVFAVPGKADSPTSWGTNQLIKDGAKLVDSCEEIISELEIEIHSHLKTQENNNSPMNVCLSNEDKQILAQISDEPIEFDQLAEKLSLLTSQLLSCLTQLEMRGLVKQLPGKRFVKSRGFK